MVDEYPYTDSPPDTIGWSNGATDLGFVDGNDYSNADIICHKEAKPGAIAANVAAGGSITWDWTEWPESHHGPVITYMAKCDGDCANADKTSLKWFKIEESGHIEGEKWASDKLIADGNTWETTVPESIADGNYVVRHEIIGLHSAGQKNGAQNYPQCINVKVTGGGSDNPEGTLGTELYSPEDPGLLISIYEEITDYKIPGPALYTGGSSGNGGGNSGNDGDNSGDDSDNSGSDGGNSGSDGDNSKPTQPEGSTPDAPSTGGFTIPENLSYDQLLGALREITNRLFTTKQHARDLSARQ